MSSCVAYFSAEFGIDESLPIYSGGLGVLAGDHIKAANELDLPLVGVGIFYSKGYFRQRIREDGVQEHLYPRIDPAKCPVAPVLDPEGRPIYVEVPIGDRTIALGAWTAQVGRVPVYLLTSDVERNGEQDRRLTDHLYPSDPDTRICQEIILGIGGVRLLRALGVQPGVWHLNEGHSAFLTLERIREYSAAGVAFDTALEAVKASTVFTTHTPVPAGHDVFGFEIMDRYLGDFYWQLGADRDRVLALGRIGDGFNMTRLAVTASTKVNGVSKLHEEVTKELLHRWMPHIPREDIPVTSITNGIHIGTWLSPGMKQLFERYLGFRWETRASDPKTWAPVRAIPSHALWERHRRDQAEMIERLGLPLDRASAGKLLIVGFARRFATYKRAYLLFEDLERLDRIVNDPLRPVCFVFAGKAHPSDRPGQELIRKIVEVSKSDRFKGRIFVVENYDMEKAKALVQGVDVWLNTPVKPMEASGTSGQKAAINGVLNCSILDGWWNEGYNGRNGWAIEGAAEGSEEARIRADSNTLYTLLEKRIAPLYYSRDEYGIPANWVAMMKESICTLAPKFNTLRMVNDYWNKLYVPVMTRGSYFAADGLEIAGRVAAYKRFIRDNWHQVRVGRVNVSSSLRVTKIGLTMVRFEADIRLGPIWHKDVKVEAVGPGKKGIWKSELALVKTLEDGMYRYEGSLFLNTDALWLSQINVRIVPVSRDFSSDFELELSAWGDP